MIGYDPYHDQQPVTWWRGYPIHTPTLLVIIHVSAMLITTFVGADLIAALFAFSSEGVLQQGKVWQLATYALVHPPQRLLWFAVEMYLLWAFGRELERFFGRRQFLQLYGFLLLLTPAVLLVIRALTGRPTAEWGSSSLHFALFIAFATVFPGAPMLFGITAKWVAVILFAINSLEILGARAWDALATLWVSVGAAIAFVLFVRGQIALPSFNVFKRKPKLRVLPNPPAPVRSQPRREPAPSASAVDDIDPLLDKIARSGMNSLTPAERALLEKARAALLKKDPGSR